MLHLRGQHAADAPEKIEGIKIDTEFVRLHLLHSTGYGEAENPVADGTVIGEYVVHYADDTTARIPIVYGEDVRDWWVNPARSELKRAKPAWTGTNAPAEANMAQIRLYSVAWENPHPEKKVRTIDFVSKKTECDPFLIALTVEKK
jgi:beta-galactosidase